MSSQKPSKLLTYARLLRIPNVFTAFADICMAGTATGVITADPLLFVGLLVTSGCLYLGGMVLNDWCDRHEDADARPFRPIPSGAVSARTALLVALGLLLLSNIVAAVLSFAKASLVGPLMISICLTLAIWLYNSTLKHTPAGPIAMGACRFLNVLLGLSIYPEALLNISSYHLATVIGIYIVGVTWFARTEEGTSRPKDLLLATFPMVLALIAAATLPAHQEAGSVPFYYLYLLVVFAVIIGGPIQVAIRSPKPANVQQAVKRCILGLVILDAILATLFVGLPGLLILLLLPPALILGKWVYST